ncbi:tyrosine-type recombinase/integrase [Acinetobacter pollinis]|uniref:tyrosine-type recombinase/integrase n=1 Tax=Acinetobacter pollinis TaxID=2605270 RepID=UPI0018C320B4|nr:tyrosine-type recombinase/integrase [Acinetobacter pollinis]MBF7693259.1 tyrosine-type recombinase/integrase [Acinetobacter pollinis]MBF7699418.1 tyrosine-type recombinase/integrase [Acinetobacter pollinis]
MAATQLTDSQCKQAKPKDKPYRLSDVNGLSLQVSTNGTKYWNLRLTINGDRKSKSIGKYPDISLKKARDMASRLKVQYAEDSSLESPKPQFSEVAEDWFENQKGIWSDKHISNVRASLDELYLSFGNHEIDKLTAPIILEAIRKIENRGSLEVAKRTLSRCGMVMKYAIAHSYRLDNPASDLAYALKSRKVKNLASLQAQDMPEFLKKVSMYPSDAQTHHAIMLIMLTGVRVSELLKANWSEFDIENRVWDIPEERMKNGLPHRVPLTNLMLQELEALRLTHNEELLFPHRLNSKESMRSESILQVIKRSGYAGKMTTHGFRSLFSTVLNESNLFNYDVIERQLAHVPKNRIRAAYNRAQYWEERVKMMDWYEAKVVEWIS